MELLALQRELEKGILKRPQTLDDALHYAELEVKFSRYAVKYRKNHNLCAGVPARKREITVGGKIVSIPSYLQLERTLPDQEAYLEALKVIKCKLPYTQLPPEVYSLEAYLDNPPHILKGPKFYTDDGLPMFKKMFVVGTDNTLQQTCSYAEDGDKCYYMKDKRKVYYMMPLEPPPPIPDPPPPTITLPGLEISGPYEILKGVRRRLLPKTDQYTSLTSIFNWTGSEKHTFLVRFNTVPQRTYFSFMHQHPHLDYAKCML